MSVPAKAQKADERADKGEILGFAADSKTERELTGALERMGRGATIRRGGIRAAIEHFQTHPSPRVIIVDLAGSAMPINDIDQLANVCEPGVNVIAVGDDTNIGLFRDLVHMGVTDYLVKPVPYNLLHRALATALDEEQHSSRSQRTGKVVACTGARGGVGATTSCVNVAWILANRMWRRVVLVDLDVYNGVVGLMLDVKPNHGLRDALENASRIDALFLERAMMQQSQRLFVLSSEEPIDGDVELTAPAVNSLTTMLKQQFHYIFLDVPRHSGQAGLEILRSADVRVIVADPTVASVRDVVRRLQAIGGEDAGRRNIIALNHPNGETKGEISLEQFEEGIGQSVDFVMPYGKAAVVESLNFGQPVAATKGPVTDTLVAMAGDLVGEKPETASLLKRILKKRK